MLSNREERLNNILENEINNADKSKLLQVLMLLMQFVTKTKNRFNGIKILFGIILLVLPLAIFFLLLHNNINDNHLIYIFANTTIPLFISVFLIFFYLLFIIAFKILGFCSKS